MLVDLTNYEEHYLDLEKEWNRNPSKSQLHNLEEIFILNRSLLNTMYGVLYRRMCCHYGVVPLYEYRRRHCHYYIYNKM